MGPETLTALYDEYLQAYSLIRGGGHPEMTPLLIVTGNDMNDEQTTAIREEIELALHDPDYVIVTNFPVEVAVVNVPSAPRDTSNALALARAYYDAQTHQPPIGLDSFKIEMLRQLASGTE